MFDIVYQLLKPLSDLFLTALPLDEKNIVFLIYCNFIKSSNECLTSTCVFGTYHILANISDPLIAHADAVEQAILILA